MNTSEIKALGEEYIINTYGSRNLAFVRGEGTALWDADGKEYLDFFAGIAVVGLGHCHPAVTDAICHQARTLVHVSNLYHTQPQVELAKLLCKHTFADRWFFSNCGATAIESAIKIVRRYWHQKGTPKPEIIAMDQSFHGRTMAAITATGQPKYHEGFAPMLPGIKHVPFNDLSALRNAVTDETGAIFLELIQGEGGVRVADEAFVKGVRKLCDAKGVLLVFDEVQTGMGRTGKLFAHEHYGVTPDVMCVAKALGNGVPIGAMGCTEEVASGFSVGSHATTFGGNPLCTAAAKATLETMVTPGFLDHVAEVGGYFLEQLKTLASKHPQIVEVRGKGLMIGVEMKDAVAPVIQKLLAAGIVCGPAGPNVLRFVPPLIVTTEQVDRVVSSLDTALGEP
jgi:predicted acetylornithine/succinylornithine family transaminase